MKTCARKIVASYIVIFAIIIGCMYPLITYTAQQVVAHSLHEISNAPSPDFVQDLKDTMVRSFLFLLSAALLLFTILTWSILGYVTRPVKQIMQAVRSFHERDEHELPHIHLRESHNDEFSLLAETLNCLSSSLKNKSDKMMEMRKEFIANASHELKTPITIIRGFAETLHENPHLDKKTTREITEKIVKNCRRLTKIIKNLLTLADIEHLPIFKLQRCDVNQIIENCKTTLLAVYPRVQITVHADSEAPCLIDAEPDLMEIAIYNLLDNAAKYSKEMPVIDIFISHTNACTYIAIQDNGIGIPKQDLERIYERFYTVNKMGSAQSGSSAIEGSGIGLSIVKSIIQKHGGAIQAESTLGKGSRFTIRLPDNIRDRLEGRKQ